jgi:eukaryotic-like serine/threonine-protein kinase
MGPTLEQSDTPPPRLGRYRLVRCISSGGMARVYEARRESLAGVAPRVALKLILPKYAQDPTFQQLFINEARIGSELQHQNLVGIQDFDREGDHFFLVMEYVEGITLRRAISTCRRNGIQVPLAVIAELGRQIADGLYYAHEARNEQGQPLYLVHRDIKPSNVMLNPQGVAKVLDFGISKALTIAAESSGTVKGTWGYMAPEQAAADDVSPPADQYGVAAVLYELAMLQPLFPEKKPAVLRGLMAEDEGARRANRLSGEHAPLASLLVRALQRDPAARFRSCRELSQAMGRLVPDPASSREQLVSFFSTLRTLSGESTAGPRSGPSAVDSAGSGMTLDRAAPGLPVAVGNERHPYREAAPVASQPEIEGGLSTGAIAMLGVAVCVIGFTLFMLFARPTDTSEPLPIDPVADVDPDVEPVEDPIDALLQPAEDPTVEDPAVEEDPVEEPVVAPVVVEPVTPRLNPKPKPKPVVVAPAEPAGLGMLTISSLPRSKVIVDGQFVRYTPLFQHEIDAGAHSVRLETDDGRRTTFKVDVPTNGEVRRIWHFETGQWVEQ